MAREILKQAVFFTSRGQLSSHYSLDTHRPFRHTLPLKKYTKCSNSKMFLTTALYPTDNRIIPAGCHGIQITINK